RGGGGAPRVPCRAAAGAGGGRGLEPVDRIPGATLVNRVLELRDHPPDRHGRGVLDPQPKETFAEGVARVPFDALLGRSRVASGADVDRVLARQPLDRTLEDFATLLSPAAGERLEDLAVASRRLTLARFGRTMHLYAPLYLS